MKKIELWSSIINVLYMQRSTRTDHSHLSQEGCSGSHMTLYIRSKKQNKTTTTECWIMIHIELLSSQKEHWSGQNVFLSFMWLQSAWKFVMAIFDKMLNALTYAPCLLLEQNRQSISNYWHFARSNFARTKKNDIDFPVHNNELLFSRTPGNIAQEAFRLKLTTFSHWNT